MCGDRRRRLVDQMDAQGIDALVLVGPSNQEYAGVSRAFSDAMRVHYEPAVVVLARDGVPHVWTPYPEAVRDVPSDQVHRELPIEMPEGVRALAGAVADIVPDARRVAIDELTSPMLADLAGL